MHKRNHKLRIKMGLVAQFRPINDRVKRILGIFFDTKLLLSQHNSMLHRIIIGALALLFAVQGNAQSRIASYHDEKTEKWTVRIYDNDPLKTREYTLLNGMKVITSLNKQQPRISTMVVVKTGSKNDPADHTGLAHYLEHMLFKGTDQYGSLDWAKEKVYLDQIDALYELYNHSTDENERINIYRRIDSVSQIAATFAIANEYDKMCQAMGASGTNAFTSNEMTVYVNDVPSNMFHKWIELEAERYRNPILRLFHTELEAVYEEKNISLDDDNSKVWEKLYAELFQNHNYGKQTTIGTVEHLKNPSLLAIRDYYKKYYVPNNMAVVLSGDFDPDVAADAIAEHFNYMKPAEVPQYSFEQEMPHVNPRSFDITGPDAAWVTIGYRLPGAGWNNGRDARAAKLVDLLLNNSSAGLIDLNLVKKQKVLSAYSTVEIMPDYSIFILSGKPKAGQSLEEVRDLLTEQMNLIIEGKFDDELLKAIILNEEISRINNFKDNATRCYFYMDAFINGMTYQQAYNELWEMQRMRKEEIMEIAAEYLNKDRVEIFKREGADSSISKITKPEINPVALNRDKQSTFVTQWLAEETEPITPVYADFDLVKKGSLGDIELYYVRNTQNRLFTLEYRYEYGRFHNKKLPLAMKYLSLAGTAEMSAEEIGKKMYSLGCKFYAQSSERSSSIVLTGPEENFDAAVTILESLLAGITDDDNAMSELISNEEKARSDAKLNNRVIASRVAQYALYGANNPSTWVLSTAELRSLKASEVSGLLSKMASKKHAVMYYGMRKQEELQQSISSMHKANKASAVEAPAVFTPIEHKVKTVYFVNYDMVQASIWWMSKSDVYKAEEEPVITAFNQYFGGDMSSVVFQNIRESKALAYSTYAYYNTPSRAGEHNTVVAFIGTQADKFHDAVEGMNELLKKLPKDENVFALSKESIKNRIETERIDESNLTYYLLAYRDLNISSDPNKEIYAALPAMDMDDIAKFHKSRIAGANFAYGIVASQERLSTKELEKYGKVSSLTLEQIFGY
jgi:predicted Zn-dependent peptidase